MCLGASIEVNDALFVAFSETIHSRWLKLICPSGSSDKLSNAYARKARNVIIAKSRLLSQWSRKVSISSSLMACSHPCAGLHFVYSSHRTLDDIVFLLQPSRRRKNSQMYLTVTLDDCCFCWKSEGSSRMSSR